MLFLDADEGGKETTRLDEAMEAIAAQGRERGFVTSR